MILLTLSSDVSIKFLLYVGYIGSKQVHTFLVCRLPDQGQIKEWPDIKENKENIIFLTQQ